MAHVPSQYDVTAAIRAQLGVGVPADKQFNRTPPAQVGAMIETSKQASAINPLAKLDAMGGGTPVGPEALRPAR